MSILSAFNNTLIEFADDLILVFPDDNDLKVYKNSLILLQKTNPRKVQIIFHTYIINYKDQILNKDEDFFINDNYDSVKDEKNIVLIDRPKNYWSNISNSNKDKIWKYFEILISLSLKCSN